VKVIVYSESEPLFSMQIYKSINIDSVGKCKL